MANNGKKNLGISIGEQKQKKKGLDQKNIEQEISIGILDLKVDLRDTKKHLVGTLHCMDHHLREVYPPEGSGLIQKRKCFIRLEPPPGKYQRGEKPGATK